MSRLLNFLLISGALAGIVRSESFDPYSPGPYDVITFSWNATDYGLEKNVELWAPSSGGPFPVVYFSGSLAGTVTVRTVNTFLTRVASHGFAIMAPWKLGNPNYTVEWIDPLIDFTENNFLPHLIENGADPNVKLDFTRMFLMGHSAGNHINVNYMKRKGCRNFIGQILLSPVDGTDPFGIIRDDMCIEDGKLLHYEVPTLTAMGALDPIPGAPLFPACAPRNLSNLRFYDAMPGDRWFVNASDYGHVDFFEQEFIDLVDQTNFCSTKTETDKPAYRNFTSGLVVSFMAAKLDPFKYCSMLQYVENPEMMNVEASVSRDVGLRCSPGHCAWWQPEE